MAQEIVRPNGLMSSSWRRIAHAYDRLESATYDLTIDVLTRTTADLDTTRPDQAVVLVGKELALAADENGPNFKSGEITRATTTIDLSELTPAFGIVGHTEITHIPDKGVTELKSAFGIVEYSLRLEHEPITRFMLFSHSATQRLTELLESGISRKIFNVFAPYAVATLGLNHLLKAAPSDHKREEPPFLSMRLPA